MTALVKLCRADFLPVAWLAGTVELARDPDGGGGRHRVPKERRGAQQ